MRGMTILIATAAALYALAFLALLSFTWPGRPNSPQLQADIDEGY